MSLPLFFTLGELNIAVIDIVVLLILLIAVIVGLVRGFAKQILVFLGFVTALIVAFFVCRPVTDFIENTFPQITEMVSGWITSIPGIGEIGHLTPENAQEALNNSSIPFFLHGLIINLVNANGGIDLTPILADYVMLAIVFVLLTIILLILFAIVKKLFLWISNAKFIKPLDKFLGCLFSVLLCALIIIVVLAILVAVAPEFVTALLTPTIAEEVMFESITNKVLTFVMEQPFVANLFAMLF
ncbi:MAG: CvpA family protein [Clostridia bacterium]|nr:CvpA family protein [Clostridia bacterium]